MMSANHRQTAPPDSVPHPVAGDLGCSFKLIISEARNNECPRGEIDV
jgi:hypothetical protein